MAMQSCSLSQEIQTHAQSSLSMTSSVSAPSEVLSDTCMACHCQIYNCMFIHIHAYIISPYAGDNLFYLMLGPPVLPYAGTTCSTLCWDHLFYLMLGPPVLPYAGDHLFYLMLGPPVLPYAGTTC